MRSFSLQLEYKRLKKVLITLLFILLSLFNPSVRIIMLNFALDYGQNISSTIQPAGFRCHTATGSVRLVVLSCAHRRDTTDRLGLHAGGRSRCRPFNQHHIHIHSRRTARHCTRPSGQTPRHTRRRHHFGTQNQGHADCGEPHRHRIRCRTHHLCTAV